MWKRELKIVAASGATDLECLPLKSMGQMEKDGLVEIAATRRGPDFPRYGLERHWQLTAKGQRDSQMLDSHTFGHLTPQQQANRLYALADRRDVLAAEAKTPAERFRHQVAAEADRMSAESIREGADDRSPR